jgi:hypothetical protein
MCLIALIQLRTIASALRKYAWVLVNDISVGRRSCPRSAALRWESSLYFV